VPIYQAVILGIVQGLTEFLPVSSTAHLILVPLFLGFPDPGLAFDVALHLGTLAAVFWYFAADVGRLARAFFRSLRRRDLRGDPEQRLAWLLILGSVPAAALGLALERHIETTFRGPLVIAAALAGVAVVLFIADRLAARARRLKDLGVVDALAIGLGQALALVPGVSRSGATITAGILRGLSRDEAARFAFLLGIPIILGSALAKLAKERDAWLGGWDDALAPLVAGIAASAATGYLAIAFLLRYVRKNDFTLFVVYRIALAVVVYVKLA
jgi:undecaprenyl-diphosphatase